MYGFQNNRGKLGRGQQERQSSMLARTLQTAVIGTMNTYCGGNNRVLLPQPTSICIPLSRPPFLCLFFCPGLKTNKLRLKCLFPLIVFSDALEVFHTLLHFFTLSCVTQCLLCPISPTVSCWGFKDTSIFSQISPSTPL